MWPFPWCLFTDRVISGGLASSAAVVICEEWKSSRLPAISGLYALLWGLFAGTSTYSKDAGQGKERNGATESCHIRM